ncbi:hypothetical protein MKQ68_02780 [Chitinophaga horti]|uniref:Uncharacterized protein n=1 Tax=Chitinophaga horti TaxID=2920382 RepID=A0ABY6J6U1_9BACT|nr:hypothetical protein [Chitinophaga horti]UYQ94016.1 hypothetical protein MKQ68_02780 [Chitinophaga horti]
MIEIKPSLPKLDDERILSAAAFVKLFERDRHAIESAKFIAPKLGSENIAGYVRVKFKQKPRVNYDFTKLKTK